MSKILISPLGTGGLIKNGNDNEGRYREVKYYVDNKEYNTSFIAKALDEHLQIDKIILVGTVKSMWDEVYTTFAKNIDEKIYEKMLESINNATHNTSVEEYDKFVEVIKKATDRKIYPIIMKYGMNRKEFEENFVLLFKIFSVIEDGDEIYLDITHSFRSMSFYTFIIIIYLQIISAKNVEIKGIYYGMLDVVNEFGYAPVVELSFFLDIIRIIIAASEFKNYGKSYNLLPFLQGDVKKRMKGFSDAFNMNYIASLKSRIKGLKKMIDTLEKNNDILPFYLYALIVPEIKTFVNRFSFANDDVEFMLELVKWYIEHNQIALAYIVLKEAIALYIARKYNLDFENREFNSKLKEYLHENIISEELKRLYINVNKIRINIAHSLEERENSLINDITNINLYMKRFEKIMKEGE